MTTLTPSHKVDVPDDVLELAKQAIKERDEDWGYRKIQDRLNELINENINLAERPDIGARELDVAPEQASYIIDFEPGYDKDKDYPLEQEQ